MAIVWDYLDALPYKFEQAAEYLVRSSICLVALGRLTPNRYLCGLTYFDEFGPYKKYDFGRSHFLDWTLQRRNPGAFFGFWGYSYNQTRGPLHPMYATLAHLREQLWPTHSDFGDLSTERRGVSEMFSRNFRAFMRPDPITLIGGDSRSSHHEFPDLDPGPFFVLASSVDSDAERAGLAAIHRMNGSLSLWQCSTSCGRFNRFHEPHLYKLDSNFRFSIDEREMIADEDAAVALPPAETRMGSKSAEKEVCVAIPKGNGDDIVEFEEMGRGRTRSIELTPPIPPKGSVESPRSSAMIRKLSPSSNWPRCVDCNSVLRPNVRLGTNDRFWAAPLNSWKASLAWESAVMMGVEAGQKLVILELGTAHDDIALRAATEHLLARTAQNQSVLIRITEDDCTAVQLSASTHLIKASPAHAIEQIDDILKKKWFIH